MAPDEAAAEASESAPSWREQAVARSLDPARARAENRVQRFLDAALELMNTASDKEFTVQEVVERSGQSLRSFYQYFAGKHELLLALFEEAVRWSVDRLQEAVAEEDVPLERLHRFAVEYYRLCRPVPDNRRSKKSPSPAALADFAQQLMTAHPDEAARAYAPLVSLFEELLDGAAAAGAIRADLNHRRIAGVVLQAIMFNVFSSTISGTPTRAAGETGAEGLWDLLLRGIGSGSAR